MLDQAVRRVARLAATVRRQDGQGLAEYSLLLGLIAVVAIAAVLLVYYLRLNASLQSGHGQAWFHLDDLVAAATRWYRAMGESREFYALLPLFGVAACASLALARPGARVGFLWLATTFLYIELGTRSISAYRPLVDPLLRHVIFAIVPCAVLTGIYVGPALSTNVARWVVSVVALTLTAIVWLGGRHLPISLVGHSETVWPFAAASALAAAVTIFGSIASPLVVTSSSPVWRVTGVTTLLLAAGVSTLGPTFYAVRVYRLPWINNAREAAKFLVAHTDHPWLAQDEMLRGQLDYETAFTRSAALDVAPEEARKVGSAYIVVDDYLFRVKESLGATTAGYLRTPPPTWLQVARIGDTDEYRMRIYRALSAEDADRELSDAKRAHAASPTSETEKRVNDALVNAGNSCPLARQKWAAWRKRMPETSESELLGLIAACYAIDPSRADLNQVVYGNFAGGLGGWTHPETPGVRVETFPDVADSRYLKVTAESAAQRVVLLQSVQLAPNSVYAYEATLQSTVPIVALYISPDRARFDTQAAFYKWETRRLLFITPAWDGQPHNVDLIPFLLTAPGEIWLKNVKLNRLILE